MSPTTNDDEKPAAAVATSTSNGTNKIGESEQPSGEIWWEATPDHHLHAALTAFPKEAHDAVENLALHCSARQCRKGAGWDFPQCVRVDPRMRRAEETINLEEEVAKLSAVLKIILTEGGGGGGSVWRKRRKKGKGKGKIKGKGKSGGKKAKAMIKEHGVLTPSQRPASLIAFHVAVRDAYRSFEEPRQGTLWTEIGIGHKVLERSWFAEYSEPSVFGLVDEYVDAWVHTLQNLENEEHFVQSLITNPPSKEVLQSILEIKPLIKVIRDDDELGLSVDSAFGGLLLRARDAEK